MKIALSPEGDTSTFDTLCRPPGLVLFWLRVRGLTTSAKVVPASGLSGTLANAPAAEWIRTTYGHQVGALGIAPRVMPQNARGDAHAVKPRNLCTRAYVSERRWWQKRRHG